MIGYLVVEVLDQDGAVVSSNLVLPEGLLKVPDVNLWWPYLMSDAPAYLYTFRVNYNLLFKSSNVNPILVEPKMLRGFFRDFTDI